MKQSVLKFGTYGLITGAIIFIIHLGIGIDQFDYSTNEILGYVSIFISLSFVFFGIKHYRDKVNDGVLSIGKGIAIGLLISIMVGIGIALSDYMYTKFINPSFFSDYQQMMEAQGQADAAIEMISATAALFMLVLVTIIGFILSLISAIILQRK
ncbi:MAG: DUF4199 domain-containing protein [Psychroserpens sp.]|nr:DUF4199 domain-containing protein [Psychroserpens sp.]